MTTNTSWPLRGSNGSLARAEGDDVIASSVRAILFLSPGEVPGLRTGAGLSKLMFRRADPAEIKDRVSEALRRETRILLVDVRVASSNGGRGIAITVTYKVNGATRQEVVNA